MVRNPADATWFESAEEEAMFQLMQYLTSLARREEGQDLLEYALLIALIAIVCVGAITLAGTQVSNTFYNIASHI